MGEYSNGTLKHEEWFEGGRQSVYKERLFGVGGFPFLLSLLIFWYSKASMTLTSSDSGPVLITVIRSSKHLVLITISLHRDQYHLCPTPPVIHIARLLPTCLSLCQVDRGHIMCIMSELHSITKLDDHLNIFYIHLWLIIPTKIAFVLCAHASPRLFNHVNSVYHCGLLCHCVSTYLFTPMIVSL